MITTELRRLYNAFHYSVAGLKAAWDNEAPFRLEVVSSVVIIPLALVLGQNGVERAILIGVWMLVLIAELLNSGLEAITDYATKGEIHPLAKNTKDIGSAAVFIALVTAVLSWILILV